MLPVFSPERRVSRRDRRHTVPARRRIGFTLIELLVVIGIIGILLGLMLPAVQAARETSRRNECRSNMRNLALAALNYETVWRRFPPAAQMRTDSKDHGEGTWPSSKKPPLARHNGITFLLPNFEEGSTFEVIDFEWDWNHSRNEDHTKQNLGGILICPSAPEGREWRHVTDYIAATRIVIKPGGSSYRSLKPLVEAGLIDGKNGAPDGSRQWDGILQVDSLVQQYNKATKTWTINRETTDRREVRAGSVLDGLSRTWLYFESAGKPYIYRGRYRDDQYSVEEEARDNNRFRWANPETWMAINDYCGVSQIINCDNRSKPYSFHDGGTNIAYADASVRFHTDDMDPQVFVALLTIAGREVIVEAQ
jgi:prepilin-type N-terminal cleavage/methylation domain-containing protein/prepilin-type processing-associated H-X9-DG protein